MYWNGLESKTLIFFLLHNLQRKEKNDSQQAQNVSGHLKRKNEEQVCQNQNQKYLNDPRVEIACVTVMFSVVCVH